MKSVVFVVLQWLLWAYAVSHHVNDLANIIAYSAVLTFCTLMIVLMTILPRKGF